MAQGGKQNGGGTDREKRGEEGEKERSLEDPDLPVDRGWAWMILVGCFLNASLVVGYNRSLSLLFVEFLDRFQESATTTTLIMGSKSLAYSLFSLVSMHVVLEFLGTRKTVLLGSTIFSLSILCATFSPNITIIIVVHFVLGIGQSMIHAPGLVLIGQYFKKRRSLATTTASSAVSFSAGVFPLIAELLLGQYGLTGTMLLLCGLTLNMWVGASLYRPIEFFRRKRITTSGETELMLKKEPESTPGSESKSPEILRCPLEHFGRNTSQTPQTKPILKRSPERTTGENLKGFYINGKTKQTELFNPNGKDTGSIESKQQKIQMNDMSVTSESTLKTNVNGTNKDSNYLDIKEDAQKRDKSENFVLNKNRRNIQRNILTNETVFGSTRAVNSAIEHNDSFRKRSYSEGSKYARRLLEEEKMAYSSNPDIISVSLLDIDEECSLDVDTQIKDKSGVMGKFKKIINAFDFTLFKNPMFVLITVLSHFAVCARSMALYIPARVNELGLQQSDAAVLLLITGCLDFFCRIFYGFLADLKIMRVHHIMAIGLMITGIVNEFMALFTTFPLLIVYSVLTGIFGSAYQCLLPVVIVELMGLKNMAKTLGFTNLFHGLASAITHPIIGGIRDLSGSYVSSFMYLGFTSIVAALLLLCEPLVRRFITNREKASQARKDTENDT